MAAGARLCDHRADILLKMRRRATAMILTASLLAGCTAGSPLSSIRIVGSSAISEAQLRESAEGCREVEECVSLIEGRYFEEGYVNVKITREQSRLEGWSGSRGGTLSIEEGPQFHVGAITFVETDGPHDDGLASTASLEALGRVRTGSVFRRSDVAALLRAIYDRYQIANHPVALVVPVTDVNVDARRVDLRFEITRGPKGPTPAR